jgi:hypothetical protein
VELAKPRLDVGCFTNRQKELDAFYSEEMGLPFEGVLHIGPLAPSAPRWTSTATSSGARCSRSTNVAIP